MITTFDGKQVEYVEVHDEPIHRRQFSNKYVYVYIAGIRQVWPKVRVELPLCVRAGLNLRADMILCVPRTSIYPVYIFDETKSDFETPKSANALHALHELIASSSSANLSQS